MNHRTDTAPKTRQLERGFSVAEVLVATAIFAIIFVAALLIYDRANRVFKHGVEAGDLQQNTRIAFDRMIAELRMAGFDFDRDGIPKFALTAQQPDEQIEYAGISAITFRANFNADDGATQGGREFALEPPTDTASQFPIVTTGNDEIVTYALESVSGPNDDTITFFADVTDGTVAKRQSYPGGSVEDQIDIDNVDLCDDGGGCLNPPYNLLRITLSPTGAPVRTVLASNIRSMTLEYFSDVAGATSLAIADAGGGQYNPADPSASVLLRAARQRIRAFNLTIVGMNENRDAAYTDTAETVAAVADYRKFTLNSLVVPRNLGKRGLIEQQAAAPGAPTLKRVCFGWCGVVKLEWEQPVFNINDGSVDSYVVLWDTDIGGTGQPLGSIDVGASTEYYLGGLDPNQEYRFSIAAANSYDTTYSDQFVTGFPRNSTTCDPPTTLTATEGAAEIKSQVGLAWVAPLANVAGQDSITCETPAGAVTTTTGTPRPEEYKVGVYRGTEIDFNPTDATLIASATGNNYRDLKVANCRPYYYRLRILESACLPAGSPANFNSGVPLSPTFEPDAADDAVLGQAGPGGTPATPTGLLVEASSACASGLCNVDLEWNEVTTEDSPPDPIRVDFYRIQVDQYDPDTAARTALPPIDVDRYGVPAPAISGGIVSYRVANLAQLNSASTPSPYQYYFTVSAQQCGSFSGESNEVEFPKCTFDGGQPVASIDEKIGGSGNAADPYQIVGVDGGSDAIITITGATNFIASYTAYESSTNAVLTTETSSTPAASHLLPWLGGPEGSVYRIEWEAEDAAGCKTSGRFYVLSTDVSCPFGEPASPAPFNATLPVTLYSLRDGTGAITQTNPDKENYPFTEFELRNLLVDNSITIASLSITWDQSRAPIKTSGQPDPTEILSVAYPQGAGTANASLAGATTTSGTFTAGFGALASSVPLNNAPNYKIKITFDLPGNQPNNMSEFSGNPITAITVFYRVQGIDSATDPARECTIFP